MGSSRMKIIYFLSLSFLLISCLESEKSKRKNFLSHVQTLLDDDKNKEVIEELTQALQETPKDHDYTLLLAEAYLREGGLDLYEVYRQIKKIHETTSKRLKENKELVFLEQIPTEDLTSLYTSETLSLLERVIDLFTPFRYDESLKIKSSLTEDEKDVAIHEVLSRLIYLFFSLCEFIELVEIIQNVVPEIKDKIQNEINSIDFKDFETFSPDLLKETIQHKKDSILLQNFNDIKDKIQYIQNDYTEEVALFKKLLRRISLNISELIIIYNSIDGSLKTKLSKFFEKDEVELNVRGIDYILSWKDGLENGFNRLIKEILSDERHPEIEILANLQRFQEILRDFKKYGSLEIFLGGSGLDLFFDKKTLQERSYEVKNSLNEMKKNFESLKENSIIKNQIEEGIKKVEESLLEFDLKSEIRSKSTTIEKFQGKKPYHD